MLESECQAVYRERERKKYQSLKRKKLSLLFNELIFRVDNPVFVVYISMIYIHIVIHIAIFLCLCIVILVTCLS